jgi:hypothetical protein
MRRPIGPSGKRLLLFLCILLGLVGVAQGDANEPNEPNTPLESLGPEPEEEEDLSSIYLRNTSVILPPGTWDLEVEMNYRRGKSGPLDDSDLNRQFRMPMTARFGICRGWEGSVSAPLIYSYRELSDGVNVNSDEDIGFGDVTAGASFQVAEEKPSWPEMVGTFQVRAPTGRDPYRGAGDEADLGSGHWTVSTGLQFVRTTDPLVLFWGIGYIHQFSERSHGQKYEPGEGVTYNMGLGFSVNDDVSLSGRFAGVYQGDWEIDGDKVEGTSYEPMSLRLAATLRYRRRVYLEPAVSFGLNDDAPDVVAGVALITRLP